MLTIHGNYQRQSGSYQVLDVGSTNCLVRAGDALWKFYKHRFPGDHPEVEISKALGRYLGHVTEGDTTVALITPWLRGATNAWDMRESLSEGHLYAIGQEARRMHIAMEELWGNTIVPAEKITHRLKERARQHAADLPEVARFLDRADAVFDSLNGEHRAQRVHGDLHLGQILHTQQGGADAFAIIDFEGEPGVAFAERAQVDPPERDLAGMVRSCQYAGLSKDHIMSFRAGYGEHNEALLRAYVVDKVLYEIAYEGTHRPDWVHIPLGQAELLLGEGGA